MGILEVSKTSAGRVCHGYRKTHGVSKTGIIGMGTVLDFSKL
jgi:hypothetical protein